MKLKLAAGCRMHEVVVFPVPLPTSRLPLRKVPAESRCRLEAIGEQNVFHPRRTTPVNKQINILGVPHCDVAVHHVAERSALHDHHWYLLALQGSNHAGSYCNVKQVVPFHLACALRQRRADFSRHKRVPLQCRRKKSCNAVPFAQLKKICPVNKAVRDQLADGSLCTFLRPPAARSKKPKCERCLAEKSSAELFSRSQLSSHGHFHTLDSGTRDRAFSPRCAAGITPS